MSQLLSQSKATIVDYSMSDGTGPINPAIPGATAAGAQNGDSRPAQDGASRPLFSGIAERLADFVKTLRRSSTMRESLEEVLEESERESQELSSQERLMLANLLNFGGTSVSD